MDVRSVKEGRLGLGCVLGRDGQELGEYDVLLAMDVGIAANGRNKSGHDVVLRHGIVIRSSKSLELSL
jgi:hypothetical protein